MGDSVGEPALALHPASRRIPLPQIALLVSLGVFWGLNWPVMKIVLLEIPPFTARALAFAFAIPALLVLARLRGESLAIPRGERVGVVVTGLLTILGFTVLAAFSQLATETSRAAIVTYTMPVWATVLSALFLGERLTWPRVVALALGMGGLALLLGRDLTTVGRSPAGALLALGAALSWAGGIVTMKSRTWSLGPIAFAAWMIMVSLPPVALASLLVEHPWTIPLPSPRALTALALHVIFPMVYCYAGWVWILARMPASVASIGTLIIPVVGVLGANVLLGEALTAEKIAALTLVVSGVALVLVVPARETRAAGR